MYIQLFSHLTQTVNLIIFTPNPNPNQLQNYLSGNIEPLKYWTFTGPLSQRVFVNVSQMCHCFTYLVDCASDSRKWRTFIFEPQTNQSLPSINNESMTQDRLNSTFYRKWHCQIIELYRPVVSVFKCQLRLAKLLYYNGITVAYANNQSM